MVKLVRRLNVKLTHAHSAGGTAILRGDGTSRKSRNPSRPRRHAGAIYVLLPEPTLATGDPKGLLVEAIIARFHLSWVRFGQEDGDILKRFCPSGSVDMCVGFTEMAAHKNSNDAAQTVIKEDSDVEEIFDPELFIDRSYTSKDMTINGITVNISALHSSASTDFDLTGQVVWPASEVLALYLTLHPQLVVGGSILEVGAGVGLAGLVAAKLLTHPRRAVLTDNQEEVLTVLRKNTDRNFTHLKQEERPRCAALSWGEDLVQFSTQFGSFDVILGADVVFWPSACDPLFQTVAHLLKPEGQFLVGYVARNDFSTNLMYACAEQCGLSWSEEELNPNPAYKDLIASQAKCGRSVHLLRFTKR